MEANEKMSQRAKNISANYDQHTKSNNVEENIEEKSLGNSRKLRVTYYVVLLYDVYHVFYTHVMQKIIKSQPNVDICAEKLLFA